MPPTKPKPSEIAAEAKKQYIPFIAQKLPHIPPTSFLHQDVDRLRHPSGDESAGRRPRVAVIDGAPVDVALDWYEYECSVASSSNAAGKSPERLRIPVVNMANEKRAGGDWESGLMAPEENLCRRSNLVHCLTSPQSPNGPGSYYPIPLRAGIYSPNVGKYSLHSMFWVEDVSLSRIQLSFAMVWTGVTRCGTSSSGYQSYPLHLSVDQNLMKVVETTPLPRKRSS